MTNPAVERLEPYARLIRRRARLVVDQLDRTINIVRSRTPGLSRSHDELELPLDYQWKRVIQASRDSLQHLPNLTGARVLFAQSNGLTPVQMAFESTLAMAMRMRGVESIVQSCNSALPACEFNCFGNFSPDPGPFGPRIHRLDRLGTCHDCTDTLRSVYDELPVLHTRFSDYLRPDDTARFTRLVDTVGGSLEACRSFCYRDIPVGEQARATTLRFQSRATLDDSPYTAWLVRRYLLAGIYVAELTHRMLEDVKPECVVMTHGIYITHGVMSAVARQLGLRVAVYGGFAYRKGTVIVAPDETYHRQLLVEPNILWESLELTREQNELLDEYLNSKRFGGMDRVSYHPTPIEDRQALIDELQLDPSKKIVSLYTNVMWDAQIYYTQNAFGSMLEWLFTTMDYLARRDDLQLVIRVHPGEVRGGIPTNQQVTDEIKTRFPVLPPNIKVVPPGSHLSSYTLAEMSCAALIYGTKLAIELATWRIPVIIAGEAFSRGKGFTYDAGNAEGYIILLDKITELPPNSDTMVARARKYAYHFFFRRMIDLPMLNIRDPRSLRGLHLRFENISELAPGRYKALDLVCDGILTGKPFVYDPI